MKRLRGFLIVAGVLLAIGLSYVAWASPPGIVCLCHQTPPRSGTGVVICVPDGSPAEAEHLAHGDCPEFPPPIPGIDCACD